jgi:UDP-2,3-diacylglucosamine hydrolase
MATELAAALKQLATSGTSLYFLHGNRDFLIGDDYCRSAGMQHLQEPVVIDDWRPGTALMHGDTLCTDDQGYQRFRARVRNPAWQARVLSRPLWWRRLLARIARIISKQRNRGKPAHIMDVNAEAVRHCFRSLGIQRLIHGHTHRPALHRLEVDGQLCERIVLGDWHGAVGSVLEIDGDKACLMMLRRNGGDDLELVAV